jgi:3D (Asp-Asp-Asp) domain-containing protein
MKIHFKAPIFTLTAIILALFFAALSKIESQTAKADFNFSSAAILASNKLAIAQDNTVLSISSPVPSADIKKLKVIITAYSSTVWQTDNDPFITASGKEVRDGIIANNLLPFGTRIMIPELFGSKIFTVEDRMSWKKSNYHFDIWFPEYVQAKNFGAKVSYIEILEN